MTNENMDKVYMVTIARTGVVYVKGVADEEAAMDFATKLPTSKIMWDDEWEATDAMIEPNGSPAAIFAESITA